MCFLLAHTLFVLGFPLPPTRALTRGYALAPAEVDYLMFEVGLSQYLADDIVLSTESRRMTLEFARLARIRDRHSRQIPGQLD